MSDKGYIWTSVGIVSAESLYNIISAVNSKLTVGNLIVSALGIIFWIVYIIICRKRSAVMKWSAIFWGISAVIALAGIIVFGTGGGESLIYAFLAMIFSSHLYGIRYFIVTPVASLYVMMFVSIAFIITSVSYVFKIKRGDYT